jgi:hypothetical protein
VKGAGYRGKFGGAGWDGMWTDMSEIVRPTRDGIHGREFISTVVDIGSRPTHLTFDQNGRPRGALPRTFSLPIPFLFDAPPPAVASAALTQILAETAAAVETLTILPLPVIREHRLSGPQITPLARPEEREQVAALPFTPRLIEMDGWDRALYDEIRFCFPDALVSLRLPYTAGEALLDYQAKGIGIFHFVADYHGRGKDGRFVLDLIRDAHAAFVDAGIRDAVTLLGSGGIVAAEHVPKAIIAGLDAVALDTPLLVALQATFDGDFRYRNQSNCTLPENLTVPWGTQRLQNMLAAWRDQLLEILGAMGLREVRRLRGEIGRAMFQRDLEREAFGDIDGYPTA